jgi:hypothetical protein
LGKQNRPLANYPGGRGIPNIDGFDLCVGMNVGKWGKQKGRLKKPPQ